MISTGISMDAFYDYYDSDISMGQKDFFDSVVSMLEYFYTHTLFFPSRPYVSMLRIFLCSLIRTAQHFLCS